MAILSTDLIRQGASGASTGYEIDQSIRFNAADTPKLTRTPSSTGNRDKWTFSAWVKRSHLTSPSGGGGNDQTIFVAGNDVNNWTRLNFLTTGSLNTNEATDMFHFIVQEGGTNTYPGILSTNKRFRDVSAWYHIVAVYDSGNATASDRMRIYVNGVRENSFANETYVDLNEDSRVNHASTVNRVGCFDLGGNKAHFSGYMAEIHLLDGYAYDSSYFGEFKEDTDIWIPKKYSGSYGTNGFYLKGENSAALGNDSSGNDNDFSSSGLAADDQQPDSPTNNHATFSSIDIESNGFSTFSEGNLAHTYSGNTARVLARSTIQIPASTDGFFEMKITADLGSGVDFAIGIEDGSAVQDASNTTYTNAYIIREDGTFSTTGSASTTSYGTSFDQNDVVGVWRKANGDLVFYKNGTAMNSGTPAVTGVTGAMHFVAGGFNGGAGLARFASSQWTNTPTGVSSAMALNTKNLGS